MTHVVYAYRVKFFNEINAAKLLNVMQLEKSDLIVIAMFIRNCTREHTIYWNSNNNAVVNPIW